jgi:exodeoxyribonuclease VII small subunit
MNGNEKIDDVGRLSFEEALGELEGIVRRLEEGSGNLEDSIVAYERGVALQRHCDAKLQEAQMRVERIVLGRNGVVAAEPISFE